MADVSQNISAQLFVKELPAANRADFTGCQQDFNSPEFTTCVNNVNSDTAVENAFQSQLSLSEYYKSPQVFNTIKNNYMKQTMEGHFETEEVNLNPDLQTMPPEVSSAPTVIPVGPRDFIQGGIKKTFESFGQMKESFGNSFGSTNLKIILLILLIAIGFYFYKKKQS